MGLHPSGFMWGSRCGAFFPQMGKKIFKKPNPCWKWLFLSCVLINRRIFRVILSEVKFLGCFCPQRQGFPGYPAPPLWGLLPLNPSWRGKFKRI